MGKRFAAILISLLTGAGVVFADGGMFFRRATPKYADVYQPTQKVYIRWDGSQEKLLIQTKYEGPAEEMVWIVPVPSEPAVETGDEDTFETLSDETSWPDITHTRFSGSSAQSFGPHRPAGQVSFGGGSTPVVQWRRRIGDYDVVLLRPVNGEDVVAWLNANEFAIPEAIHPILEDYIADGWWMVASRIHPDALSDITREKLANGTLHPLEMTFQSSSCVYPMRLTSMAAGPVEELIYIEGPTHYEPLTLSEGDWQIDIFGGPIRQVPQHDYRSDIELAIEVREGRTQTKVEPRLTKLRRVFRPEEMTQDLVFTELDSSKWLESNDPLLIGQAATQYGRSRDPNGILCLVKALSSGILEEVRPAPGDYQSGWLSPSTRILSYNSFYHWDAYRVINRGETPERISPIADHVFSCIWALGEIAVENNVSGELEDMLLQCALHDNQLVRMEAYIALTKLRSERLGPILTDRLAWIPDHGPSSESQGYSNARILASEMDIVVDWISQFGTAAQKEALSNAMARPLTTLQYPGGFANLDPQWSTPGSDWFEWVIRSGASTRDARLLAPLGTIQARFERDGQNHPALRFIQRAEAACGSTDAAETLRNQIVMNETATLAAGRGPVPEDIASLDSFYAPVSDPTVGTSLRVQTIQKRWVRYHLYPMPSEAGDRVLRSALSMEGIGDWYALYLLAGIKHPQGDDMEKLMQIWDKGDPLLRVTAVDVLYAWGDSQTLLALHGKAESAEVQSEIVWALTDMGAAQAVRLVEQQVQDSWNTDWLNCGRAFLVRTWEDSGVGDPNFTQAVRTAEAIQTYFQPQGEDLDAERLVALKRLCDDSTIHPGLRVALLATNYDAWDLKTADYSETDWGRPLLRKAVRELLEAHPRSPVVNTLATPLTGFFPFTVDVPVVVEACGDSDSDEFRRTLLIDLFAAGNVYNLPVIEGLLREVWPRRYVETEGQSILFREPGDLAASLDYYCEYAQQFTGRRGSATYGYRPTESMLQSLAQDGSLPAGYRAFLLAYWPTAPNYVPMGFVESLLQSDMPDFIKEALTRRLALDWPQV